MIDWPRVRQLRNEVGTSEFDEVVAIFLDEVQEALSRFSADTNREGFEQNLHFLKGAALSLGFKSLAKLCQDGERQSAQGQSQMVDVPQVFEVFESSCAEFKSGLGKLKRL
ncbi:Hpt domain-containing protein [Ruegeria lacuscaerulensis]|uniref:Hpt domain-containing protein n=1 Tax=Ruegeria lacuscaerulensis TaxID=55218 RepID=UPI00147CA0DF|nr:Hpt domain-containing protein [Ruegeria lacuscaerulensis]